MASARYCDDAVLAGVNDTWLMSCAALAEDIRWVNDK